MDTAVLNEIFRFKDQEPSSLQTPSLCETQMERVVACVAHELSKPAGNTAKRKCNNSCEDDSGPQKRSPSVDEFSTSERDVLTRVLKDWQSSYSEALPAPIRGDVWCVRWLPEYAAVLQLVCPCAGVVHFRILALDEWKRVIHLLPNERSVSSAVPTTMNVLNCGELAVEMIHEFIKALDHELLEATKRVGSKRSAAHGEQPGHQKTPTFMQYLVRAAIAATTGVERQFLPQGGMTDVGMHTGGLPRDTCWPLVCAVIRHSLPKVLCEKVLLVFRCRLLETELVILKKADDRVDRRSEVCFQMLENIVESVDNFGMSGGNVASMVAKCENWRLEIDSALKRVNEQVESKYALPTPSELESLPESARFPKLYSPTAHDQESNSTRPDDIGALARQQVEGFEFIDPTACTPEELIQFLVKMAPSGRTAVLGMRNIEAFMWQQAKMLAPKVSASEVTASHLWRLVEWYRDHLKVLSTEPRVHAVSSVDDQSLYILVAWVAFCRVHQICCAEYCLLEEYGIALDWRRLSVCVLGSLAARQSLQSVAGYICEWERQNLPSLFSLSHQEPTLSFGRRVAQKLPIYCERLATARADVAKKLAQDWARIKSRKDKIVQANRVIDEYQDEISKLVDQLAEEKARLRQVTGSTNPSSDTTRTHESSINQTRGWLRSKQNHVSQLQRMREFVVSQLPRDDNDALEVLFFLDMPSDLNVLGQLCCTAQRALGPETISEVKAPCQVTWTQHLSSRGLAWQAQQPQWLTAFPVRLAVPDYFGADNVNSVATVEDYRDRCLWFPDGSNLKLCWQDETLTYVNPFGIPAEASQVLLTARVTPEWEWANAYPVSSLCRGNESYARADTTNMSTDDFAAYTNLGTLRAYPVLQLRKVFLAMLGDALPWRVPVAIVVVLQALYQVGDLTDETSPHFSWHVDLLSSPTRDEFCRGLEHQVSLVEASTTQRWRNVLVLGEVAGFLSQYEPRVVDCVLRLSRVLRRLATEVRLLWQGSTTTEERTILRSKECVLYGCALVCHSRGECTSDDELHDVCELVVLFHNSLLFASDERHAKTIEKLNRYVAEIVSRRILHIVDYVMSRDSSSALSALCRLANARFPENLDWSPLKASFGAFTSSFEATDVASGQHYLLNLATGMILTDGNPPSSLPPRIRDVPRYIDLFGDKDFEVTHSSGVFSTVYSTNGCFYNFAVDRGDLIVEESSEDGAYTIQLCSSQWIDDFNEAFPDRLTELHSHWYCPQQDCVLLRGRQIDQKTVFFVVEFDKDQALCAQVPTVDQLQLSMRQIVQKTSEYSVFVAPIEPIVRIFSKFEDARYIHFLSASEGVLEIELPRAELSFFVREGRIYSKNYCDYVLASNQQLHDGFSRFHRHLVLQSCAFRSQRRIVVPFGTVVVRDDGMTDVLLSEDSSDHFSTAVFDEHPRLKVLVTESIESRLLLVVIYAASGRFVPSKALSMTGGEAAIELLRGCTPSRPLSSNSMKQLRDLFRWTHRTPALKLLAALLIRKSCRLSFLYDNTDNNKTQDDKIDCCAEQDEYETICRRKRKNELCQLLTRAEEREYFGIDVPWHADITELADSQLHELKGVPVPNTFVAEVEDDLSKLVTTDEPEEMMHVFPFDRCELNVMGDHMMAELEESWESHHTHPQRMLAIIPLSALLLKLNAARERVAFKRGLLDKYLAQAVQASQSNWCERLWRVVNRVPTPTKVDLIRSVVDKTLLVRLVPKLTIQSQRLFHEATLRMMELCVLEDKIERLIHAARAKLPPPPAYFVEELLAHRGWSTLKHPYWLVFEVEAELQIRPEQFIIAQHLIRNPSSVCQLNMGRGKTRVILPMLFLYFSHDRAVQRSSRVVRAHFLGSLLSETRQFMHRSLTAGILRLPMLEQPFERKVSLELMDVLRMQEAIDEIKRTGGVLTVAAEHRLSLELKYLELTMLTGKTSADKSPLAMALKQLMSNDQFIDVFDESDVMLHHKYHLVYSVQTKSTEGRSTSKPSEEMRERWLMAEALLSTLSNPASKRVRAVLDSSTDFWCVEMEYSDRPGGFNGIRFRSHADSDTVEVFWNKLRVALVEDMVSQAPFDLLWLQVLATHAPQFRDLLNNMVCDVSVDPERILSQMPRGVRVNQLLALRGLLAFGVLEHCLEKRNRVSFGLPQPGTRTKALAIPFKAADIPSDRAEFSHPDVGIALTLLAYYHAGLRDNEVHKTFEMLLRLDVSEQESYYTAWFESVKTSLSPEEQQQLGSVNNLVLDDVALMARLCQVYRFSMEVVNFYLNRSVFPRDTYQFPHRLARSAWDLVKGSSNIGFSGTNDNHRLLPLAVTQQGPDNPSLKGTNGKMLDLMIGHSRGYVVLKTARNTRLPVWKTLLLTALTKKCRALIDTGALLAGIPTHGAAMFLIEQSDSFSGVTYYDTRDDYDCWVVLDVVRRVITPLKSSAIHERDTFVVFDEARSRGSDMKLLPDACAMLTLGPKMTKDKLMQGAGRMRQLGCDQTLWLTSTDEVQQSIQRVTRSKTVNLDVRSVLKWVVTCTQEQCTLGLLEWANSAVEFCTKESDSSMELREDDWSLRGQYGFAQTPAFIRDAVCQKIASVPNVDEHTAVSALLSNVDARSAVYGLEVEILVTNYGQECEHETQVEKNQVNEQVPDKTELQAREEVEWDFEAVLCAKSVLDLGNIIKIDHISTLVESYLPGNGLCNLPWQETKLYATKNFLPTVDAPPRHREWTAYFRMIDVLVVFSDGTLLILSECEAGSVVDLLQTRKGSRVCVVHLERVKTTMARCGTRARCRDVPLSIGLPRRANSVVAQIEIGVMDVLACCLLNGETAFLTTRTKSQSFAAS